MLTLVTILVGVLAGFAGSRVLRRPSRGGSVPPAGRPVGRPVGSRRDLELPDLQRTVLSEMLRHVRPERGASAVPAEFRVRMHPDDKATVDQAPGFFRQGLEEALARAGAEHGWTVPSRLRIDLDADPSRRRGAPAVDAREAAAPGPAPTAAPAAPAPPPPADGPAAGAARLERDGRPDHRLDGVTSIGRAPECDLVVDDGRVSRRHAVIQPDGPHWAVTDQGSSNGTRRNGHRITPTTPIRLADGDEIGVGPVTFRFRAGPGGSGS